MFRWHETSLHRGFATRWQYQYKWLGCQWTNCWDLEEKSEPGVKKGEESMEYEKGVTGARRWNGKGNVKKFRMKSEGNVEKWSEETWIQRQRKVREENIAGKLLRIIYCFQMEFHEIISDWLLLSSEICQCEMISKLFLHLHLFILPYKERFPLKWRCFQNLLHQKYMKDLIELWHPGAHLP